MDRQQFLSQFSIRKNCTFEEFSSKLSVLDISDTTGKFATRSHIDSFLKGVSKKDNNRLSRLDEYKKNLYRILVTDAEECLSFWFDKFVSVREPITHYLHVPSAGRPEDGIFDGRSHSSYGRLCKNINFYEFYSTKKLYENDSEFCLGLIRAMFEDFKVRNSMVCPAFFGHVCETGRDYSKFWSAFMLGANKPSVFNPAVYRSMLDHLMEGDVLFAPTMGWNSYQLAFYGSKFKHFVSTDVIPSVIENGNTIHAEYLRMKDASLIPENPKTIDLRLCPSEMLGQDFIDRYEGFVDGILFSPPYFDLEIYSGENQSVRRYPDYRDWLERYWEKTIKTCFLTMRKGARMAFIVSNYMSKNKTHMNISEDMSLVAGRFLSPVQKMRVKWSSMGGSRQAKKTRAGNFEDVWVFERA